jgi:hypothetical protein
MDTATQERLFGLGMQAFRLAGQPKSDERNELFNEIALLMAKNRLTFLAIPYRGGGIHRDLTVQCGAVDCMNPDDLAPVLQGMLIGLHFYKMDFYGRTVSSYISRDTRLE